MEAFAEKLKASAVIAAKAAQKIATTGFDEMAATDEYVQSEGFNAVDAKRDPRVVSLSASASQQQLDLQDDTSTLSTHSSAWVLDQRQREAARNRSTSGHAPPLSRLSSRTPPHEVVPLKVSVPERQLNMTNARQEDNASVLSSDNDNDSSDDYEDPIMSFVRKQHGPQQNRNAQKENDDESSFSERHLPADQRRKKTNRFMDDLESRMAKPEQEHPPVSLSREVGPRFTADNALSAADGTMLTSLLLRASTSMRFPVAVAGRNQSRPANSTAPLARNSKRRVPQQSDGLDDVAFVSSLAMLGDAEMQELDQLRQQQQQSTKCVSMRRVFEILQQHPKEAFILFTLLLGSFVYFYSNNRSLEE